MKSPITAAQAKSQRFFETINSLGKMADELRAKVDALTKERDALAEQVSLLKTTNEMLAEKLTAAETAHLRIRTQSLDDAASLCESQAEQLTYPSTGNAIALVCAAKIRGAK